MSDKFDMKDMVKLQNIQIKDSVDTWEDAVRVSLKPLVDGGYAEPRYAENVIADIKNVGPYVVLTGDIALIPAGEGGGATILTRSCAESLERYRLCCRYPHTPRA